VSVAGVRRTGFAASDAGLLYALAIDATGKTAAEVHAMRADDRYLTAKLRARFYDERSGDSRRR